MSDLDGQIKISELAELAGVPVATVRHYLREGLLPEGTKTSRNMAYYPPELAERIKLIKHLQEERFMPLRVIGELLDQGGDDPARIRDLLEAEGRLVEKALAPERERTPRPDLLGALPITEEALDRLAELGVVGDGAEGYSPAEGRIIEAITRFRSRGFDESVGFTVHDAANFVEPLADLARREVEMLSGKVVGHFSAERASELVEAGIEPLEALISAMHTRMLAAELERRFGRPGDGQA